MVDARGRSSARAALGAACWLSLIGVAACESRDVPEGPHNAIVILVDTLRADHLSSYGYERETSPNLDAFAARNVRFANARSQAACTAPSVNSLLTSRHPLLFLRQDPGHIGIPKGVPSLAEILQREGYFTLAISASPIVRRSPSRHNRFGEFDRGFDLFHEDCFMQSAACVNRAALEALEVVPEPFLLYAHYMDPHAPYAPPSRFERRYSADLRGDARLPLALREGRPQSLQRQAERGSLELDDGIVSGLRDLYDDEIQYFDTALGLLLDELDLRGLLARSVVVIASDHGEAFGEREYLGHCRTPLFEAMTSTPLVFHLPEVREPRTVAAAAENLDIVPTVLDYLGVERPDLELSGRSLRALIEGDASPSRVTFASQSLEVAATDERYALTWDLESRRGALFDRVEDPAYRRDLSDEQSDRARALEREVLAWLERADGGGGEIVEGARQLEAELRALGYIE